MLDVKLKAHTDELDGSQTIRVLVVEDNLSKPSLAFTSSTNHELTFVPLQSTRRCSKGSSPNAALIQRSPTTGKRHWTSSQPQQVS